jgi:hypothetical protein
VTVSNEVDQIELSPTAAAGREFIHRLRLIAGARLETTPRDVEGIFRVRVPELGEGAGREVVELEGELLDRYPGARLDVWLIPDRA